MEPIKTKKVQRFKSVVQGGDESAREYAARLEKECAKINEQTENMGMDGMVMPFMTASGSGRMTCMLVYFEYIKEKEDGQ
jgi:hypothetical protein